MSKLTDGNTAVIRQSILHLLCLTTLPELVVHITNESNDETKREDSASNRESSSITRPVILAEYLRSIDAGNIGTHDHSGHTSVHVVEERIGLGNSQGHRKSTLLGIGAGERHPRDVQRMRESAKGLRPDNAKVPHIAVVDLGEDAVENVTQEMATEARHDGFTTPVAARD